MAGVFVMTLEPYTLKHSFVDCGPSKVNIYGVPEKVGNQSTLIAKVGAVDYIKVVRDWLSMKSGVMRNMKD